MREEQGSSTVDVQTEVPEGSAVLQEVVRMTGFSESYLDTALAELLGKPDTSVNDLTLEQLRALLLECLESVNQDMSSDSASGSGLN